MADKAVVSSLDQLKKLSTVVADTGDFEQIRVFSPLDATTNPSLILKAVDNQKYAHMLKLATSEAKATGKQGEELVTEGCDRLSVAFGCEILKVVPGVVSTEIDATLSFDTEASITKARRIVALYEEKGISKERVLIKMAATWEGCCAASALEAEGIHCNMTLLFSMAQAKASAEAGATLISPFVGRILDWYKARAASQESLEQLAREDPGVVSVTEIYNYYKQRGYKTVVMGASFRNVAEILSLAGCDKLTISPALLDELKKLRTEVPVQLIPPNQAEMTPPKPMTEAQFRWELNQNQMATEKLSDGIRLFHCDGQRLRNLMDSMISGVSGVPN